MKRFNKVAAGNSTSRVLEGAISPNQDFVYGTVYWNPDQDYISYPNSYHIGVYVPENFTLDEEKDLFYNENGAVLNAYNLSNDEDERKEQIQYILSEYMEKYPEYDLNLIEGSFPMSVEDEIIDKSGYNSRDAIVNMSNYILYIKNYEELLNNKKTK